MLESTAKSISLRELLLCLYDTPINGKRVYSATNVIGLRVDKRIDYGDDISMTVDSEH